MLIIVNIIGNDLLQDINYLLGLGLINKLF